MRYTEDLIKFIDAANDYKRRKSPLLRKRLDRKYHELQRLTGDKKSLQFLQQHYDEARGVK